MLVGSCTLIQSMAWYFFLLGSFINKEMENFSCVKINFVQYIDIFCQERVTKLATLKGVLALSLSYLFIFFFLFLILVLNELLGKLQNGT